MARARPLLMFVAVLVAESCVEAPVAVTRLEGTKQGARLVLSRSLNDVAAGEVLALDLSANLTLGGSQAVADGILQLADLTTLGDGRIAVLDRLGRQVRLYDSAGALIDSLGREGQGPGEFRSPYAVAAVGEDLVIWDEHATKTFTLLTRSSDIVVTARQPVAGDWSHIPFRHPLWSDGRFQMPLEDVTSRLGADTDSTFIHQLQPDERWPLVEPFPYDSPPSYLIRYDRSLSVVDTVARLRGPPSVQIPALSESYPQFFQPIWSSRPLWAAGAGWLAIAQGDSAAVEIRMTASGETTRVEWPGEALALSNADHRRFVEWMRLKDAAELSPEERRRFGPQTRREQERTVRRILEELIFAREAPVITTLVGYGRCLAMSGFDTAANPRGRSNTFVILECRGR